MSLNRVIGCGNKIPWRLPEDFKWFKETTTGHVIVMGRRTFESIGKLLPDRETIILSKSGFVWPGARTIRCLSELNPAAEERDIFICGGAQIYEQALPLCSDLFLTLVKRRVEGDAFFPKFEQLFTEVEIVKDTLEFRISHFRNDQIQTPGSNDFD